MTGPHHLLNTETCWTTDLGAWFPEQGRVAFRGKDLLRDLKDLPWMGLLLFGITGNIPSAAQARLFEGIWTICTSYPEPRLWNNRVGALAGTTRSTAALGIAAATAISEASVYGRRPDIRAIDLLYRLRPQLEQGADLSELLEAELAKYRVIPGYGRPITSQDERIEPLMSLAKTLGFAEGYYVKLVFAIEDTLRHNRRRTRMNIAALAAALAADQGLSPRQYYHYLILSFSAGISACYVDAFSKPEGSFFPLRCERVIYTGHPQREWAIPEQNQASNPNNTP